MLQQGTCGICMCCVLTLFAVETYLASPSSSALACNQPACIYVDHVQHEKMCQTRQHLADEDDDLPEPPPPLPAATGRRLQEGGDADVRAYGRALAGLNINGASFTCKYTMPVTRCLTCALFWERPTVLSDPTCLGTLAACHLPGAHILLSA